MEQLRNTLRKAVHNEAPALIRGEPGVGKGTVARLLIQQSPCPDARCIDLDCAATPEETVEAQLLEANGNAANPSASSAAKAGTTNLILEEVGALSMAAQEQLLTLLQSSGTGLRIVATSSRDLEQMVQANAFREDLLLALNIVPIFVPAFRDRGEDIMILAEHFRAVFAKKHGVDALAISPFALIGLKNYSWPGNVRELRDAVERAVIRCQNGVLEPEHFSVNIDSPQAPASQCDESELLDDVEKKHIFAILERCRGNRTHAAKRLGISLRTLRNKLREYRLAAEGEAAVQGTETVDAAT